MLEPKLHRKLRQESGLVKSRPPWGPQTEVAAERQASAEARLQDLAAGLETERRQAFAAREAQARAEAASQAAAVERLRLEAALEAALLEASAASKAHAQAEARLQDLIAILVTERHAAFAAHEAHARAVVASQASADERLCQVEAAFEAARLEASAARREASTASKTHAQTIEETFGLFMWSKQALEALQLAAEGDEGMCAVCAAGAGNRDWIDKALVVELRRRELQDMIRS
jgi:hypothetical protein